MSANTGMERIGVEMMAELALDPTFLREAMVSLPLTEVESKTLGTSTSHTQREVLMAKARKNNVSDKVLVQVVMMAAMCKNRDRLVRALKGKDEFADHLKFIQGFSQYNGEGVDIAFVNVPATMPGIAMLGSVFKYRRETLELKEDYDKLPLFAENTFFAQLHLETKVQEMHKAWEKTFWDDTVKKTRRKDKDAYEKGFQAEYYQKKVEDQYQLPAVGDFKSAGPYNLRDIIHWAVLVARAMTGERERRGSLSGKKKKGGNKTEIPTASAVQT